MTAYAAHEGIEISSFPNLLTGYPGCDVVSQDVPCCFPRFIAVERSLRSGDFAPSGIHSVRYSDHDDMAILSRAENGLEGMQEPHPQLAHFNLFDKHGLLRERTGIRSTRLSAGSPRRNNRRQNCSGTARGRAAARPARISGFVS